MQTETEPLLEAGMGVVSAALGETMLGMMGGRGGVEDNSISFYFNLICLCGEKTSDMSDWPVPFVVY